MMMMMMMMMMIMIMRWALLAETSSEDFSHENRVRMYMTLDKIFNYFASYQLTTIKGQ